MGIRHSYLKVGDPCPVTGKPYDGFSWTSKKPYDTCRACAKTEDPMREGLASSLKRLEKKRRNKSKN